MSLAAVLRKQSHAPNHATLIDQVLSRSMHCRHHPRRRVTQYSREPVME
jgi:hypothetical protein